MIGRCKSCRDENVPVRKVDGGSAGVTYLCEPCHTDMLGKPFTPGEVP